MPENPGQKINIGLSEKEKNDLEKMIKAFQKDKEKTEASITLERISERLNDMNRRLAYLTDMFLKMDSRMKPLFDIVHLSHQKSKILNSRIDDITTVLEMGKNDDDQ